MRHRCAIPLASVAANRSVAGVLALPFLVGILALRGLSATLTIFHSDDEFNYHLPTIRLFAHQLPFPDLIHYHDAQPPLFYFVMAIAGKVVGFEVWRLRLVEVAISFALALAAHSLLHGRLGQPEPIALALALLFALSPYVLGSSFRVITDNLATLFIVLALERCHRFGEDGRLVTFAAACGLVGCAMLTRQSAAFMLAVIGWYAVSVPTATRGRAQALGLVVAAIVPVGALFLAWGGIVPPNGDPSACGLCTGSAGGTGLTVATPELALAALGLYGTILFAGPLGLARLRSPGRVQTAPSRHTALIVLGAVVGVIVLLVFPDRPGPDAAGPIAAAARHAPVVLGSSLLLWALIPVSGAIVVWRVIQAPQRRIVIAFAGAFLLGALAIRHPWQKYVDPFVLLSLLMSVRSEELRTPAAYAGVILLAIAFIVYVADPALHPDTPAPRSQRIPSKSTQQAGLRMSVRSRVDERGSACCSSPRAWT